MNQYDQWSLLYAAVGTFKKAATVASKLIFNDSDHSYTNNDEQLRSCDRMEIIVLLLL